MPETTLKFTVDANGAITSVDQLGKSLGNLDKSAKQTKTGFQNFVQGTADLKAGFDILASSAGKVIDFASELVNLGTASRQAKEGLDTLSGGKANAYLEQMRAATRGLVNDTDLLHSATKAMALGLAQDGQQLSVLAKAGTVLGRVMGIDAAQGVETLTVAMSRVNQTMLLDNIGLSAFNVTKRFQELKKTMSEQDAWSAAVLEEAGRKAKLLEGNLDGAGSGVKRLENAFTQLKTSAGENLSFLLDQTLALTGALDAYWSSQNKRVATPTAGIAGLSGGVMPGMDSIMKTAQDIANLQKAQEDAVKYKYLYLNGATMADALLRGAFGQGSVFRSDTWTGATAAPDYDKQYRDAILAQQTAREVAKREANKRYGSFAGIGGDLTGAGGDFAGAAFGAAGSAYKRAAQVPEALRTLNQIIAGGQALLDPYAKGINKIADAYNNMTEAAKRGQSLAAAFGTGNGGLFGQIGGNMDSLFATAREKHLKDLEKEYGANYKKINEGLAALSKKYGGNTKDAGYQKELRGLYGRYGSNTTAINKGMEIFDKGEQQALDAYKIATGQATKASLEFDHQIEKLGQRLKEGKITPQQYAKELYDMGIAAQTAGNDVDALMVAMGRSSDAGSTKVDPAKYKGQKKWGIDPRPGAYTGQQTIDTEHTTLAKRGEQNDPFASLKKGVGDLDKGIQGVTDKATALPQSFDAPFQSAADKVLPLQRALDNVNTAINQSMALKQNIEIIIRTSGGGNANGGQGSGQGGRKF